MNERRRQHYLQALGIESYVPRWILPAAAESPLCELLVEEESAEIEAAPATPAAEPAAPEAPSPAPSPKIAPIDSLEPTRKRQTQREPSAAAPRREHRFALSVQRLSPAILALDSRRLPLALPVDKLLFNISMALRGKAEALPSPELLRWPLAAAAVPETEESIAEARAMLRAYLQAQYEKQPFQTLLLMGADALRHSFTEEDASCDFGDRTALAALLAKTLPLKLDAGGAELKALVLPSSSAILNKPALKPLVWRALKGLSSRS